MFIGSCSNFPYHISHIQDITLVLDSSHCVKIFIWVKRHWHRSAIHSISPRPSPLALYLGKISSSGLYYFKGLLLLLLSTTSPRPCSRSTYISQTILPPALFGDMATLPPPHPHFQVQDRVVKCHESHRYVHPCEINSQSLEIGIWKIHCVFFFLYIYFL